MGSQPSFKKSKAARKHAFPRILLLAFVGLLGCENEPLTDVDLGPQASSSHPVYGLWKFPAFTNGEGVAVTPWLKIEPGKVTSTYSCRFQGDAPVTVEVSVPALMTDREVRIMRSASNTHTSLNGRKCSATIEGGRAEHTATANTLILKIEEPLTTDYQAPQGAEIVGHRED